MSEQAKAVFCFHSVLSQPAVPEGRMWPSDEAYKQYLNHLRVEPDWFYSFVSQAVDYWGLNNIVMTFDDAYLDTVIPAFHCALKGVRTIVFVPITHVGSKVPGTPLPMMGWRELDFLSRSGVEIGSHGCTHIEWDTLSDKGVHDELVASLAACRSIQKDRKKKTPISIAPPHGTYSVEQHKLALSLGFDEFFGTVKYPVGNRGVRRRLANCRGYITSDDSPVVEHLWPWKR